MQRYFGLSLGAALAAALFVTTPAAAETAAHAGGTQWQLAQAQAPQQGKAPAAAPAAQGGGDSGLKQRVEQLEEQLVDMQVLVGTLESLARGGGAAASPAPRGDTGGGFSGGADDLRIDGLETQVRALAAQLQQLTTEVRALSSAPPRADQGALSPAAAPDATHAAPETSVAAAPSADHFGSTTVTAGTNNDAIGGLIDAQAEPAPAAKATAPAVAPEASATQEPAGTQEVATAPPAFMPPPSTADDAENPKQLYETAYGYLMQRDYGAAQSAFEQFLNRYPKDSLAGNAQYWLGEAHFVRGEYKAAAGAFLKGYQNYSGNARAADSLLKLAMSLDRLGQKDAACTSFSELNTRFPDAPDNVKSRAHTERQRIGCP